MPAPAQPAQDQALTGRQPRQLAWCLVGAWPGRMKNAQSVLNAGEFVDAAPQLATSMSPEGPTPNDGEGRRIQGDRSGQVATEPFNIPEDLAPVAVRTSSRGLGLAG